MAGIPSDLFHKLTVRVPRGQQGYWDIIRALGAEGQEFALHDVYMRTNVAKASVSDYIRRLVKGGYLKLSRSVKKKGVIKTKHFVVLKPVGVAPSLRRDGSESPPTLNGYMWRAMKMLPPFDANELVRVCDVDGRIIAIKTARGYLMMLHKAGYLRLIAPHSYEKLAVYQFVKSMDTGHHAPRIMKSKIVWDQNLNQRMGEEPEFVEAA